MAVIRQKSTGMLPPTLSPCCSSLSCSVSPILSPDTVSHTKQRWAVYPLGYRFLVLILLLRAAPGSLIDAPHLKQHKGSHTIVSWCWIFFSGQPGAA